MDGTRNISRGTSLGAMFFKVMQDLAQACAEGHIHPPVLILYLLLSPSLQGNFARTLPEKTWVQPLFQKIPKSTLRV